MYKKNYMFISSLLVLSLLWSASFATGLSDIQAHWAKSYISHLVSLKCINGYPDQTFRPDTPITHAAFTKILVTALGHTDLQNSTSGHWATHYIDKAIALGLMTQAERNSDFKDLDQMITRGQIARMINRVLTEDFSDQEAYAKQIKDYSQINPKDQAAVLKMYRSGIITGYTDGSFKDQAQATRAEATTMIVRYLDQTFRVVPELKVETGVVIEEYDDENMVDFSITLNVLNPLEPQYQQVHLYIKQKTTHDVAQSILEYIKPKTNYKMSLANKIFTSPDYKIRVISNYNNPLISIQGY